MPRRTNTALWAALLVLIVFGPAATASDRELPVMTMTLGGKTLTAEVAVTPTDRNRGLMNRARLAPDRGMLFVFETERPVSFWMKNTLIPLDIAFVDRKGKILQIQTMAVPKKGEPLVHYRSRMPVRYALEVHAGWFAKNGVAVGQVVPELVRP